MCTKQVRDSYLSSISNGRAWLCLKPKELPTEVLPICYSGNQKEWHHSADVRPRAESSGNHDLTHSNGNFYGNFYGTSFQHVHDNFLGTFHDDFHNKVHSSVIPGIRLPVPRRQQREETSEPRLSLSLPITAQTTKGEEVAHKATKK